MSKHTPGPWKWTVEETCSLGPGTPIELVGPDGVILRDGQEDSVFSNYEFKNENCHADAALIAAAPDLLEALKTVSDALYQRVNQLDNPRLDYNAIFRKTEAVIAKAQTPVK